MGRQRHWRSWSVAAAVATAALVTGCDPLSTEPKPDAKASASPAPTSSAPSSSPGAGGEGSQEEEVSLPGLPGVDEARQALDALKVAEQGSMAGYSRDKFPHWSSHGDKCDTREMILQRDGRDVERDDQCRAVSGRWVSVYDSKSFTDASDLDIDHMVPLANAWRSGAKDWDQDKRKAFANDLTHPQLLAVSAATNRGKGDQGPEEWQPPLQSYWCVYGRAWTSVKSTYGLTVTEDEKSMLVKMLDTCNA